MSGNDPIIVIDEDGNEKSEGPYAGGNLLDLPGRVLPGVERVRLQHRQRPVLQRQPPRLVTRIHRHSPIWSIITFNCAASLWSGSGFRRFPRPDNQGKRDSGQRNQRADLVPWESFAQDVYVAQPPKV